MAQIISRLFTSSSNAAAAVKDVLAYRFGDNEVFTFEGSEGAKADELSAHIAQAGVERADADAFAQKVLDGATLVVVQAPFGAGKKATVLLDRHQPLPSPVAPPPPRQPIRYDRATPLSSIFQWPTLINDRTPLSRAFGWSLISNFSLSRTWGVSTLNDDAAPLSKRFNWPLLSGDSAPLSKRIGWSLLTSDAAPLSKRMNWNTLSSDPAPLSKWLGVPVLSKRQ